MNLKLTLPALAICLAGLPLTAAYAAGYEVTYDAVVTAGKDVDNLFGLKGEKLIGDPLEAIFDYLIPAGHTPGDGSDEITGGKDFSSRAVITSATFTIDGSSYSYKPRYYDDVYTSPSFLNVYAYNQKNFAEVYIIPAMAGPVDLTVPFSSDGEGDSGGRTTQYSYFAHGRELIDFDTFHVSVTGPPDSVSAAPEPSVWLLMIAGVGLMGLLFRGRRSSIGLGRGLSIAS